VRNVFINKAGVSLLDLVVALAIAGVLLAVSIPVHHKLKEGNLLKRDSRRIEATLQDLASQAPLRHQNLYLIFEGSDYFAASDEESLKTVPRGRLSAGVTAQVNSSYSDRIAFYPGGSSSPGNITLRAKSSLCKVTISLRGRVRNEC